MAMAHVDFDPTAFNSPADWAVMYRAHGLQIVPAHKPALGTQWKRPAIKEWREFQKTVVPESRFKQWYGKGGLNADHPNMGMLTGSCSRNVFVVDLDTYKNTGAEGWWQQLLALNSTETALHYWQSRTGGGGRHLFFRAPEGWVVPNNNTAIGVDIKGQGGFIMLPPSLHTSGEPYKWEPGRSPDEMGELEEAPQWFLYAIDDLAGMHGGHIPELRGEDGEHIATPTPDASIDAWGNQIDRREPKMRDIVRHGALEFKRSGGRPGTGQEEQFKQTALARYYSSVRTRLENIDNVTGLEKEGRGRTLFEAKWAREMRQFDTPGFIAAAERPNPKTVIPFETRLEGAKLAADFDEEGYEVLDIRAIKALADPRWLVEGLIPEEALGFIYGAPGSGKSFIALGQALSFAMALKTWWGRAIHRPGAVIYISAEGHTDLKFRIAAWEAHHGVLADDAPFYLVRQPLSFMNADDIAKLLKTVASVQKRAGVQVTAVYVDTVSRTLPGADENLQKDMTLFIAACDQVRLDFKATVIGVHHTSRQGNLRGSTVFDGAGDFLLQVERDEGGAKSGKVTATKVKAAEDGWIEPFLLLKYELPLSHTSLVAVTSKDASAPPPSRSDTWPEKEVCRRILDAIGKAWNDGRPWSPKIQAKREGNYAPRQIEVGFAVGVQIAEQMVTAWLENGVLAYEQQSSKNHRRGLKVIGWID